MKQILKDRPTRKIWETAVADAKKLQMHVLGHGLEQHIEKIDYYESNRGIGLRRKYCKTNRDLWGRVLKQAENIWNGRGGGVFYNTTEANQKQLRSMLQDVWHGYTLRDWMANFWFPRYIDDPMGLIFMEVDMTMPNGAYPTYKGSKEVHEALPAGRRLEYIFFKTADPSVFRLVDDAKDVMIKVEGAGDDMTIKILKSKEYPQHINWFERTPAIIISDIPRDGDTMMFMSPIVNEVELSDEFLRDGSVRNIYKLKQGFPRGWKYPEVCGDCNGTGVQDAVTCPKCKGSKVKLDSSPADVTVFSWPNKEEIEIKEKGGYISPDIKYLEYADQSLQLLEELIMKTHWGTSKEKHKGTQEETATGRWIDTQPITNRLTRYARCEEKTEEFITDMVAFYQFSRNYKGTAVNLGRRFMIEHVDEIWKKYSDGRQKGAGQSALDDLLRDYYETKFQANRMEMDRALQLMKLEPGVHLTMVEAKAALPYGEYMKKVFFPDFVTSLTDMQIIGTPIVTLKAQLATFTTAATAALPVDPLAPVPGDMDTAGEKKEEKKPAPAAA